MSYSTVKQWTTAIADAIRAKDGTSAQINHQDFPTRIAAIPAGGLTWEDIIQQTFEDTEIDLDLTAPIQDTLVPIFRGTKITSFKASGNARGITLAQYAFAGCTGLKTVNITVPTTFSSSCFQGCNALESVSIVGSGEIVGFVVLDQNTAFGLSITGATSVGQYGINGATKLKLARIKNLNLPDVTTIGQYGFQYVNFSGGFTLPATTINQYAFYYDTFSSGDYTFNVSTISANQLFYWSTFTSSRLIFPNLTQISGKRVFENARGNVFLTGNTVCTLSNAKAIYDSGYSSLYSDLLFYVPDELLEDYKAATNWSNIASHIHGISEWSA